MSTSEDQNRRAFLTRMAMMGGVGATFLLGPDEASPTALGAKPPAGSKHAGGAGAGGNGAVALDRVIGAEFHEFLGHPFHIQVSKQAAVVHLAHVLEFQPAGGLGPWPNRRPPFSLIFQGQGGEPIPQGTYTIQHQAIGAFSLFLVPVGQPLDGNHYQAVFG